MRWWARSAAVVVCLVVFLFGLGFWNRCGDVPSLPPSVAPPAEPSTRQKQVGSAERGRSGVLAERWAGGAERDGTAVRWC